MNIILSLGMRQSISDEVKRFRGTDVLLEVDKVAEHIRRRHIEDNVALEDIVEALVAAASPALSIRFG